MKKILFAAQDTYLGGGEIALINLIQELKKMGYAAILILPRDGPFSYEAKRLSIDVRIIDMPLIGKRVIKHPIKFLTALTEISKIIKRENIAYIFANTLNSGIYASIAGKIFGIMRIWYFWGCYFPKNKLWQVIYRMLFNKLVFCSHYIKKRMNIRTFKEKDLLVVYPGINIAQWDGDNSWYENLFKKENKIPVNYSIFSIIARLDPWKNHEMFIDAAGKIAERHSNSFFVIAGPYKEEEGGSEGYKFNLEKKIESMPVLKGRMLFTGFVKDIKKVIKASEVVFSCSGKNNNPEPFSISIMEIMASERPLIATSAGGTPEILTDGVNGFLVKLDDYNSMARKALRIIGSHSEYGKIVRNAKTCIGEKYTIERFAQEISAIFLSENSGNRR